MNCLILSRVQWLPLSRQRKPSPPYIERPRIRQSTAMDRANLKPGSPNSWVWVTFPELARLELRTVGKRVKDISGWLTTVFSAITRKSWRKVPLMPKRRNRTMADFSPGRFHWPHSRKKPLWKFQNARSSESWASWSSRTTVRASGMGVPLCFSAHQALLTHFLTGGLTECIFQDSHCPQPTCNPLPKDMDSSPCFSPKHRLVPEPCPRRKSMISDPNSMFYFVFLLLFGPYPVTLISYS